MFKPPDPPRTTHAPDETVSNLAYAAAHPFKTVSAVEDALSSYWGRLKASEVEAFGQGAFEGVLLFAGLGEANAANKAAKAARIANRLKHIFRSEHNLEALVRASGSVEEAFNAATRAANQALKDGLLAPDAVGILPGGGAGAILNVNGVKVQMVGGRVMNGEVRISTLVGL
jgi:hypothetical protein